MPVRSLEVAGMNSMGYETALSSAEIDEANTVIDRLAIWAARRPVSLALSCIAMICCLLGLAGSSFDYSLAAAASIDVVEDSADVLVWSNVISNMAFATIASIGISALMLALSAWTEPQTMVEVIRPQGRFHDRAD